ncbi:sulfatase [Streptomyces sp. CB02009]|uniref:sulfatase-like hydrolase/transferase n=1 Tax=Streptomyces sp. CB02009 TaxID=1703938 RepID=UPI00093E51B8|nr:sulfatase-like hydrolase/transferase [Streptomyces sp. CB02009]OKJ49500.1 sulfatase [Streptomyces sp. CB02009]
MSTEQRPDVVIVLTDEERAAPPYESEELGAWRRKALPGRNWFDDHGVSFERHYTGSLACAPSRPTLFTGHFPDVHGVTQTDGLGKRADDSRMRWLREGEVPTLGHWFRAAGYDTHYDGKWHISHADLEDADGRPLATNDEQGRIDPAAVQTYLDADRLDPFGFSGWVGPEPHGAALADSGLRRDPLIADRVVAWLQDRYERRRAGDEAALRPFLLVASFVNPHDVVLFPAWARSGDPLPPSPLDPPAVAPSPTDDEDLRTKPSAQVAFRESYPTGYGPAPLISRTYTRKAQQYRDLYYRLHAEVDGPLDRVRRAVTENGSAHAVLVRTADHGELLGAHGGLHQKWFNLYDEATRVPFVVARVGKDATTASTVTDMPTSHVDMVPTLLAAAGIDQDAVSARLRESFTEVHPLPGRNLLPVVTDPRLADPARPVYLQTRDNILEGDTGASGLARKLGRQNRPPLPLRIQVPPHVGTSFEGVVTRVDAADGGQGHLWKLVRTFDDPATWTEPGVRHRAADGPGGIVHRDKALPDEWEMYDLTTDPIEADNLAHGSCPPEPFAHLCQVLKDQRKEAVPERNAPWPHEARRAPSDAPKVPGVLKLVRGAARRAGFHPHDPHPLRVDARGKRALVVATNHGALDVGKPTGVFASEMTVPYYAFLDAGMEVDLASPAGGLIPVDPLSMKPPVRTEADDRLLADAALRAKVADSLPVGGRTAADYDLVYLAGGWGAAFDFGTSAELAALVTEAHAAGLVIGGICHGPLAFRMAVTEDGRPLVEGRRVTAVTDKQVRELGIQSTPFHPETELRSKGAIFESATRFRDPLANHWVVDGRLVTGQNQNAGPMVAREMLRLVCSGGAPADA